MQIPHCTHRARARLRTARNEEGKGLGGSAEAEPFQGQGAEQIEPDKGSSEDHAAHRNLDLWKLLIIGFDDNKSV
jgi:hypothetical protein